MTEPAGRLAEEVRDLKALVRNLERRIERLEGGRSTGAALERPPVSSSGEEVRGGVLQPSAEGLRAVFPLLGRTLLVLAGAFLLRAMTDGRIVSRPVGVALGLAYAGAWMYASHRDDTGTRRLSSIVHGLSAVLIGFPLVWESTIRYHVWSPPAAAGILAVLSAGGFAVAWRRELRPVAWVTALGATLTSVALLIGSRTVEPFLLLLIGVGVASVWISYLKKWYGFRWVTAGCADLITLQACLLASAPGGPPAAYRSLSPVSTMLLAVTLFLGYAATFTGRALALRRRVTPFEMVQMPLACAIGLGGALGVAGATHLGEGVLGAVTLLFGVVSYGVAFTALDRRAGRGPNLILYSTVGLALVLAGSLVLSTTWLLPYLWAGLALVTTSIGGHFGRATLRLHGAVYALAALAAAGVLTVLGDAFVAGLGAATPELTTQGMVTLAATVICYLVLAARLDMGRRAWYAEIPNLVLGSLGLAGLLAAVIVGVLRLGIVASPAFLAALRTVLISAASVGTALLGQKKRFRELSWLSSALLTLGGLKLVVEDLRHGTALSLFIGFASYGLALLITPRLLRRGD